jgi:hypothetical protein
MVLAAKRTRMGDGMETEQSNERAQVAEVFGLTGGELMDVAWVPNYLKGGAAAPYGIPVWKVVVFTYWYQGTPDYSFDADWNNVPGQTCRTVCQDEMFGMVPETVTDSEGRWKIVARYLNSGETECPWRDSDPGEAVQAAGSDPCPLCGEALDQPHGYIYIGDGWAEIVYRLQEPPEVHGELAIQKHVSERGQRYVDTGIPFSTFEVDSDVNERARAIRLSCEAGHVSNPVAAFYLLVWELLYAVDTTL